MACIGRTAQRGPFRFQWMRGSRSPSLADGHADALAQPAQGAVDGDRLRGMVGIQHTPHFAFGDLEVSSEMALRHAGVAERFVEGRLQRNRDRRPAGRRGAAASLRATARAGRRLRASSPRSTPEADPGPRPAPRPGSRRRWRPTRNPGTRRRSARPRHALSRRDNRKCQTSVRFSSSGRLPQGGRECAEGLVARRRHRMAAPRRPFRPVAAPNDLRRASLSRTGT